MVKKCMLSVLGMVLFCGTALAEPTGWGLSFGGGEAFLDIDVYRLGLKKDFPWQWLKSDFGYVSGYFELSFNHWEQGSDEIDGVAFSPVLAYYFCKKDNLIRPYIEGGIGVIYIDKHMMADRNLSTDFQFEDRIGVGARIGFFDLNFLRYMHYSNASIKGPNYGIDMWMFTVSIQF